MFKDINTLLSKSIKKVGIWEQVRSEQVEKIYREELERLLTRNIMERLKVLYFKDGTITVACLDEQIVSRLISFEEDIIKKTNQSVGHTCLHSVRYLT